jgi:hypothetical protein
MGEVHQARRCMDQHEREQRSIRGDIHDGNASL